MSNKTGIEWTDETWNPLRGCSRVSEGCRNCYAETTAHRFSGPGQPYEGLTKKTAKGPRWTGEVRLISHKLEEPIRWQRPRRIFVNSMSDLFHEDVSFEDIAAIFSVMASAPQHTFQVLTKRPKRMREWFEWVCKRAEQGRAMFPHDGEGWRAQQMMRVAAMRHGISPAQPQDVWPLPNVWLGVSVEDDKTAIERIPLLVECPAAVRWVSAEPLLGELDLSWALDVAGADCGAEMPCDCCAWIGQWPRDEDGCFVGIDWVVLGGESGSGARPMHPHWVREVRDLCAEHYVAFFFKQWGAWLPRSELLSENLLGTGQHIEGHDWPDGERSLRVGKKRAGHLLDGEVIRQFPGEARS